MGDSSSESKGPPRPDWAESSDLLRHYYDTEWGLPVQGENAHFERLSLEAFQAGLSWATILAKRPAFRESFFDFEVSKVAAMDSADVQRLLEEPRIIRNRRKIEATISNAQAVIELRAEGGLESFLWSFQPEEGLSPREPGDIPTQDEHSLALSRALKKRGFRFVGPTTMFALMEALGIIDTHLVSSHRRGSSGLWDTHLDGKARLIDPARAKKSPFLGA